MRDNVLKIVSMIIVCIQAEKRVFIGDIYLFFIFVINTCDVIIARYELRLLYAE